MEKTKREKENVYKNRLMSSNDHVRSWHLRGKHMKENVLTQDGQTVKEYKKEMRSPVKKIETRGTSNPERKKPEEGRRSKSPKKDRLYLELKPLIKAKTARAPEMKRPEIKRFRKPSDRIKRKEPEAVMRQEEESAVRKRKLSSFHNTWEHTNYSVVPTFDANRTRNWIGRERRKRNSDRTKKRNKSVERLESELEYSRKMEPFFHEKKRNKKIEVFYPSFNDFVAEKQYHANESGGEAVVIYHRQNKRKFLQPQTGDGYQFEQIAFAGSCETAVDLVQSKRNFSEPRRNSVKDFYVARRRMRFQFEPHKKASTQSDIHSAMDFLKRSSASVEFKNLEGINGSVTRFMHEKPVSEWEKCDENKFSNEANQNLMVLRKSKSSTDFTAKTGIRLKQTAEKKLDLHREMIRAEMISKKKFWESIERSLNYRCAVAEMFSSQSYLSSNESAKFFAGMENSIGRSTNIYVRESVFEKISSYQGFRKFVTSNHANLNNKSKARNLCQPSNSAYHQMKTVVDTIYIKEDEEKEEELLLKHHHEESFSSQSSSSSAMQTDITPYDTNNSLFSRSTSGKFTLIESGLWTSDTNSKLELLMAKLSEEIRKCSDFVKKFNESTEEKFPHYSSAKLSASDSKIELDRITDVKMNRRNSGLTIWSTSQQAINPVFVYSASNTLADPAKVSNKGSEKRKSRKDLEEKDDEVNLNRKEADLETASLDPTIYPKYKDPEKSESNKSLFSFKNNSNLSSTETQATTSTKKLRNAIKEFQCCDDCKLLKKRIIKLEKDLEKIEKRMPFYPREYQESIKNCLESLNVTSETFLKRLRSCAKLKYIDNKCRKRPEKDSKRSTSAPGPIVYAFSSKKLSVRPSNSDYHLNVGMEITMENVDPITGQKLHPEVNRNKEQEGNIQCRMIKDGGKPVLVMDTDFSYNPDTGMLFKKKGTNSSRTSSAQILIPMDENIKKTSSAMDLTENFKIPLQTYECLNTKNESLQPELVRPSTSQKSQRNLHLPEKSLSMTDATEISTAKKDSKTKPTNSKSKESTKTIPKCEEKNSTRSDESVQNILDSTEIRSESRESKKKSKTSWLNRKKNGKTGNLFSRIPIRRRPTPSCADSKADSMSLKNSETSLFKSSPDLKCCLSPSATSKISSKSTEKPKKPIQSLQKAPDSFVLKELALLNKSTQTYEKLETLVRESTPKTKTTSSGIQTRPETKHCEIQVAIKKQNEGIQTYLDPCDDPDVESESESQSLTLTESSLKSISPSQMTYVAGRSSTSMTVNVAIQAESPPGKSPQTFSVGLQTNLPTEENLKYINDLQIQKKLAKLFSFTWTFGFFLCKLVHYMQSVSAICSVLTLTAMSLERYYAIVHPMKAQYICTISQARRIITATWISAFLLAVPILFAQVHLKVGVKVEAYWCVRDWDNKIVWRAHELYMMLLILVVPTGVMAVAYTAICWEIWEVIQRRQDMTSGKGHGIYKKSRIPRSFSNDLFPSSVYTDHAVRLDNKRRSGGLLKKELADDGASVKQVIKMLVAVVVIYVICWGPMLIDNVLQAYGILSHIRMGWLKYMGTTFHLMAYFNSCINPIIYGFMSKNFRDSFRKTLCCMGKKPKTAYRSFSLSQTRNTSIRYAESSFSRTISVALPV